MNRTQARLQRKNATRQKPWGLSDSAALLERLLANPDSVLLHPGKLGSMYQFFATWSTGMITPAADELLSHPLEQLVLQIARAASIALQRIATEASPPSGVLSTTQLALLDASTMLLGSIAATLTCYGPEHPDKQRCLEQLLGTGIMASIGPAAAKVTKLLMDQQMHQLKLLTQQLQSFSSAYNSGGGGGGASASRVSRASRERQTQIDFAKFLCINAATMLLTAWRCCVIELWTLKVNVLYHPALMPSVTPICALAVRLLCCWTDPLLTGPGALTGNPAGPGSPGGGTLSIGGGSVVLPDAEARQAGVQDAAAAAVDLGHALARCVVSDLLRPGGPVPPSPAYLLDLLTTDAVETCLRVHLAVVASNMHRQLGGVAPAASHPMSVCLASAAGGARLPAPPLPPPLPLPPFHNEVLREVGLEAAGAAGPSGRAASPELLYTAMAALDYKAHVAKALAHHQQQQQQQQQAVVQEGEEEEDGQGRQQQQRKRQRQAPAAGGAAASGGTQEELAGSSSEQQEQQGAGAAAGSSGSSLEMRAVAEVLPRYREHMLANALAQAQFHRQQQQAAAPSAPPSPAAAGSGPAAAALADAAAGNVDVVQQFAQRDASRLALLLVEVLQLSPDLHVAAAVLPVLEGAVESMYQAGAMQATLRRRHKMQRKPRQPRAQSAGASGDGAGHGDAGGGAAPAGGGSSGGSSKQQGDDSSEASEQEEGEEETSELILQMRAAAEAYFAQNGKPAAAEKAAGGATAGDGSSSSSDNTAAAAAAAAAGGATAGDGSSSSDNTAAAAAAAAAGGTAAGDGSGGRPVAPAAPTVWAFGEIPPPPSYAVCYDPVRLATVTGELLQPLLQLAGSALLHVAQADGEGEALAGAAAGSSSGEQQQQQQQHGAPPAAAVAAAAADAGGGSGGGAAEAGQMPEQMVVDLGRSWVMAGSANLLHMLAAADAAAGGTAVPSAFRASPLHNALLFEAAVPRRVNTALVESSSSSSSRPVPGGALRQHVVTYHCVAAGVIPLSLGDLAAQERAHEAGALQCALQFADRAASVAFAAVVGCCEGPEAPADDAEAAQVLSSGQPEATKAALYSLLTSCVKAMRAGGRLATDPWRQLQVAARVLAVVVALHEGGELPAGCQQQVAAASPAGVEGAGGSSGGSSQDAGAGSSAEAFDDEEGCDEPAAAGKAERSLVSLPVLVASLRSGPDGGARQPAALPWLVLAARCLQLAGEVLCKALGPGEGPQHPASVCDRWGTPEVADSPGVVLSRLEAGRAWLAGQLSHAGRGVPDPQALAGQVMALDMAGLLLQGCMESMPEQEPPAVVAQQQQPWGAAAAGAFREACSDNLQQLADAGAEDWAGDLAALGASIAGQLPVSFCCNNPDCVNLWRASELDLVSGRSCICGGCRAARYCSRKCQVAHWPVHKGACKLLKCKAAAASSSRRT